MFDELPNVCSLWVTNVNIEEQIYTQVDGPLKYFIHQKRAKCIEHRSLF